jgi:ankyrin repeat protein
MWLHEDVQYRAWMDKPQGLFWIKGDPGAGKSVLMKHAVKNMREHSPDNLVVAFFFHGQGVDLQKTPLGLFRALLNSLLNYFPAYLSLLTATFEERESQYGAYTANRWKWVDKELQDILFQVLTKGTQHQPVVIFVDALDECGESSAKSLLAYFKEVTVQAERDHGRIRVCLSSRHYPILDLEIVPAVHVEKRNDRDIRWYTREQLKDIQPMLKREQIQNEILSKAGGGFQWVFIVVETIVDNNLKGIKTEMLLRELTSCPETLGELYASILRDVPATDRSQMVKIFQWVLFAQRPLSAQELRVALATDKDMNCTSVHDLEAHEGWSDTLIDFERRVKDISRGLIHFQSRDLWEKYTPDGEDLDREAQLIHQSVADYLSDGFLNEDENGCSISSSTTGAGHLQISRSCLGYLTLREILEEPQPSRGTLSSKFPLVPYAVRYLFKHIGSVEQEGIIQSDLLSALRWSPKSELMQKLALTWSILDAQRAHTPLGWPFVEATPMHVLAAFGSRSAVDHFLKTSNEFDGRDSDENTPLMLAIREGHQSIALTLLDRLTELEHQHDHGHIYSGYGSTHPANGLVNVNAQNKDGDTALNFALDQKAGAVILKLIEAGADLIYPEQEIALVTYAVSSRNIKLLSIAIERHLNLDGVVFFALSNNQSQLDHVLEDIIDRLLKSGANTIRHSKYQSMSDPRDYDEDEDEDEDRSNSRSDNNALLTAARRGLTSMVEMLLLHGSSANSQNWLGECPLLVATKNGHREVVQLLLQSAPSSVEIEDFDGCTALTVAANNNDEFMMELLLEEGTVSASNRLLEDIFLESAQNGKEDIARLLLQKNIINLERLYDETAPPLLHAARAGHDRIVKLLLDTAKVDIDATTTDGGSPLLWAARKGHEAVVKLLLDTNEVDVNATTTDGGSPLLWVVQNRHEAVVKLLVNTSKVDVNAKTANG